MIESMVRKGTMQKGAAADELAQENGGDDPQKTTNKKSEIATYEKTKLYK